MSDYPQQTWHQGDLLEAPLLGIMTFVGMDRGVIWFLLENNVEVAFYPSALNREIAAGQLWKRIEKENPAESPQPRALGY